MEKRKRDQVIKAQKEEQEAHKKRSDLEVELMKRRETLEQVCPLTYEDIGVQWAYTEIIDQNALFPV